MTGVQTCALPDRKSTRLNSSHTIISYAVFCLKKKPAVYHANVTSAWNRRVQLQGVSRCVPLDSSLICSLPPLALFYFSSVHSNFLLFSIPNTPPPPFTLSPLPPPPFP